MSKLSDFYKEEADYLLRENMNRLKGLIDLLNLGVTDEMSSEERDELFAKIQANMNSFFRTIEESVLSDVQKS